MDILSMMGLEGCMAALGPDGSVLETHEGTFWLAPWPGLQPTVGDVFWEGSKLDNTLKATVGQTSMSLHAPQGSPGQPNFSSSLSYACLCGFHVRSTCSARDGLTAGWHQQDLDTASAQPRRAPLGACLMTPASTPSTPTS